MKTLLMILLLVSSQSAHAFGRHRSSSAGGGGSVSYRLYYINQGEHYAHGSRMDLPATRTTFNYTAMFDDSAKYTSKNAVNQQDINKLIGFADCGNLNDHKNSARFGWRWYQGAIQIFAYTYADSVRASQYIGDAQSGVPGSYQIRVEGSQYVFNFNGREVRMVRGCGAPHLLKEHLYPYFGGDETAPQKVTILIHD